MIQITCKGNSAICTRTERLTSGMVGLQCEFVFDGAWDGLARTAVFWAGNQKRDVLLTGDTCTVPWEVLKTAGYQLVIGVYGTNAEGTLVIPTVYAMCGGIASGADPSGDESTDPTLPVWGQMQGMIGNLAELATASKDNLVAAINEAAKSGGGSAVEPAEDDIPKVYWAGDLPTSKNEGDIQGTIHYKSKTADFQYPATLKVQGSSSANYAKKNFTLKVYSDSTYQDKVKLAFRDWGKLNKFVLKAHWIDHSHVRNVGTAKIWGKVVESRSDYASLPEELRNAPNNGATDGFSIKFFANGVYQGLYEWIVPKDKLFGQDSNIATHSILNSELNNQPTCAFATTSPTISGNWSEELQDTMSTAISTSFANLIKFVAGSTDEEFVANAENYFDVQSVIDFDIFARVFCIVDNLCRNQIFFTYDGVKWYEGVWDVDAILGLPPTVRGFFAYDTEFQTGYIAYKDYGVTNLLYQRVENLFLERFKARYTELRSGVLSVDSIIDVYERLTDTITTYDGLLEEDYASTTGGGDFTGIPYTSENNIQQIRNFVAQRTAYMDEVIGNMTDTVPCTGISLDKSSLTFTAEGTQTLTATVTPDGCTDAITWESNNTSVATVNGGVVTAIANGNAVITATCGDYSADCSVTVEIADSGGGGTLSPGVVDGLVLHLDAINNTNNGHSADSVTWKDLSGNDADATLPVLTERVVWEDNALAFGDTLAEDILDFTNSEYGLFTAFFTYTPVSFSSDAKIGNNKVFEGPTYTVDLTKNKTPTDASRVFGCTHKTVSDIRSGLVPTEGAINYAALWYDGTQLKFVLNGATEAISTEFTLQIVRSATAVGIFRDGLYNIKLHNILVYDRALTDGEINTVLDYSSSRYSS